MMETCMKCKQLNHKVNNDKGEIWCEAKKAFVPLIAPKCKKFVSWIDNGGKKDA